VGVAEIWGTVGRGRQRVPASSKTVWELYVGQTGAADPEKIKTVWKSAVSQDNGRSVSLVRRCFGLQSAGSMGSVMQVRLLLLPPANAAKKVKGKSFAISLPAIIGRGEQATFRIPHDKISRRHCQLLAEAGRVFARDLGSTNGTSVRGKPLKAGVKVAVDPGSIVAFGSIAFRLDYQAAPATRSRPTTASEPVAEIDFLEAEPLAMAEEPLLLEPDAAEPLLEADEPELEPLPEPEAMLDMDEPLLEAGDEDPSPLLAASEPGADDEAVLDWLEADDDPSEDPR
jgi:hypothetical protein